MFKGAARTNDCKNRMMSSPNSGSKSRPLKARIKKRPLRVFKKTLEAAKGFYGRRKNTIRAAKAAVDRSMQYATRDRRAKKRDFRRLFIIRVTAAAEMRGLKYSRLIHGLRLANIKLDRKSLSELAIHDPETFDAIVAKVRVELDKHDAHVKSRQVAKTA